MIKGFTQALVLTVVLSAAKSHVASWKTSNQLHPVHEIFVKPSSDGTTGDLYIAATEESGVNTWLTDQPVNFLPQTAQASIPVAYTFPTSPATEESTTQKRAVISPPVQYAYALPVASSDGVSYSYTVPTQTPSTTESTPATAPPCESKTAIPYSPFQFFYPQLMSAYANAKTILKESGMSDEKAASVLPQASPMWPSTYAYPTMYVMVDPSTWAQSQATPTSTNSAQKENSQ